MGIEMEIEMKIGIELVSISSGTDLLQTPIIRAGLISEGALPCMGVCDWNHCWEENVRGR